MTISSANRKAGPYSGNGSTTVFPFAFKVFSTSDVRVVQTDALGVESDLVLVTNYTVALNANQDTNPGGSVTALVAPPTGYLLTITSQVANLQPVDLTNNGGFYPSVINNALDRLTILLQQLAEAVSRSLKMAISTPAGVNSTLPAPVPYQLIGWNAAGNGFQNTDPTYSTALATDLSSTVAGKGSALVGFLPAGTGATGRTTQAKLRDLVSVKDFGAVGDGTTDDTAAIQAAVTACMSINGGAIYFPHGTYKITNKITIPFATGWKIFGQSRGGTIVKQFTDNTPIFDLVGDLTHSWEISELTLTWNVVQTSANTNAIGIKMGTGVPTASGFFNFQVRRCTFYNGFRAIAGDAANSPPLWGVKVSECVFGSMAGASFFAVPTPAIGQPNICVENCTVDASGLYEPSIQISSGDNVLIRNVEFMAGSSTKTTGLMTISSTPCVTILGCKSETFAFGATAYKLWDFPNSNVNAIGCSFNGFTGTASPTLIQAASGGKLTVSGLYATSSMTGGMALAYVASTINLAANVNLVGLVTDDVRPYLGNVAVPKFNADVNTADAITLRGDVDVVMAATDDQIQFFNTTLTANRGITLPSTSVKKGMEFRIVRYNATPGAFTLTVTDPLSGKNYVIASGTKGFVTYRAVSASEWLPIAAGTL